MTRQQFPLEKCEEQHVVELKIENAINAELKNEDAKALRKC